MSIKLSELKNDETLLVGDSLVISKEDYLKEIQEHEGEIVYTTTTYSASINARDMLEIGLEHEAENMYEDWENTVWDDISEENISELQAILDRILSGSRNISYIANKQVEIDIE